MKSIEAISPEVEKPIVIYQARDYASSKFWMEKFKAICSQAAAGTTPLEPIVIEFEFLIKDPWEYFWRFSPGTPLNLYIPRTK